MFHTREQGSSPSAASHREQKKNISSSFLDFNATYFTVVQLIYEKRYNLYSYDSVKKALVGSSCMITSY